MPALYALGQHAALEEANAALQPGEFLFAFLDDVYAVCAPERVVPVFQTLAAVLEQHAGIHVNLGKTRVWNAAGEPPPGVEQLGDEAWVGEGPTARQGMVVLGTPVGHSDFVQQWLEQKRAEHRVLFDRIPLVQDTQCAWLLLLLCAGPRAVHALRNLPPTQSFQYARAHDAAMLECLSRILDTDLTAAAAEIVRLPFREGGLALRSAERLAPAAYWASWADCLSQVHARVPDAAERLLGALALGAQAEAASVREAAGAVATLGADGV